MSGFRVTYEIVTPESAEEGDAAERGFIGRQFGLKWTIEEALAADDSDLNMSLREASRHVSAAMEDCGTWFSEIDGRQDYASGAEERRSLHPPANITAASYGRLARLVGWRK